MNTPNPNENNDIYQVKLQSNQLIFQYEYETCKSYLIKLNQIEDFFFNRTLLVYSNKKSNSYYNQVFITNFLMCQESLILIVLNYDDDFDSIPYDSNVYAKLSKKYKENNGKYIVETVEAKNNESLLDEVLLNLNSLSQKNFIFVGIINNNTVDNLTVKMIYKLNVTPDKFDFKVYCLNDILTKESILLTVSKKEFKNKKLKAIISQKAINKESLICK